MSRALAFDPHGWEDCVSWPTQDRKTLTRINLLIADVLRDPFSGIGKPEPLRHVLSGAWSRRLDEANRLVYYVSDSHIVILQARDTIDAGSATLSGESQRSPSARMTAG